MKVLPWGIYLVVFCLPLYLVRFEILGIPTTVLEMLIYVLFIFWLARTSLDANYRRISVRVFKLHRRILVPIALILVGISLATIFSFDLRTSAGVWKAWFIDSLLFFIVLVAVIRNFKQIKNVIYSLFLSGVVVSIISLIYLVQGKFDPIGRLQTVYDSPNYLAMYLAPMLIIGAGYYLFTFLASPSETRSGMSPTLFLDKLGNHARFRLPAGRQGLITRKKIISSALILLPVVCILLPIIFTKSFGAWVGIIIAIAFGFSVWFFKENRKTAWIILISAVILLVALGCFSLQYRSSSLGARLIIWEKAVSIYKNSPIIGIGPGTFGNYFPPYPEWGVPQPHNLYMAFLLQTGILGFIGFVWLLIWFFHPTDGQPQTDKFKILLMMIMAYILIHGLVDTTYWKNDLAVMFWLVVGIMAVLKHSRTKHLIQN